MNQLDKDYQKLLKYILKNGVEKSDRTGTGTLSVFGRQIRHNMAEGFPLLTTKRMAVKTCMTELKWFLKGDTNIKYLVDNGCNIWNGDAYKNYEKYSRANSYGVDFLSMEEFIEEIKTNDLFAAKWGELGPIYGEQWRHWTVKEDTSYDGEYVWVDQIKNLINDIKTNPDSRRLMVNAWNVGELDQMTLPPCHYGFQVYTRELSLEERRAAAYKTAKMFNGLWFMDNTSGFAQKKMDEYNVPTRAISLMWNQRSVDTFLGLPFNIASYGMLLELIAKECNMIPGELIGNLGDVHLYNNHIKQAKEQIKRDPYQLPTLTKLEGNVLDGEFDYTIEYYESWPKIEAPLSN
jgi:thymidylate synthase